MTNRMFRAWTLAIVAFAILAGAWQAPGVERERRRYFRWQPSRRLAQDEQRAARRRWRRRLDPSACYKAGTDLALIRLDFANSGAKWPQPGGLGSAVTITYSYSNLLNGDMIGLTPEELKAAVEESFAVWASVAPLHFVEQEDSGPAVNDDTYAADSHPQIRIGHHQFDGAAGPTLAHAALPYDINEGDAGDLHFDNEEDWSGADGGRFLETALHELGHTLGLDHEFTIDAIMNPTIGNRFDGLGTAYLLEDDINGIRDIYGEGVGSVTPLEEEDPNEEPDEPTDGDSDGDGDGENVAGGVSASLNEAGDVLTITGGAEGDSVLIMSWWWWHVAVVGLEKTNVNDRHVDFFRLPRDGSVVCDLGAGPDRLWVFRLRADTLDCSLGEGDDLLLLMFSWLEQLVADGGEGSDWLFRWFAHAESQEDFAFEHAF